MDSVGNIVLYFCVAIPLLIFSIKAVTSKKILRSATYLLFVLLGTAIFYFQMGYQFLGAVQIAVYAGGIMVLFVFAILLTNKPNEKDTETKSHRKLWGFLVSISSLVLLVFALFYMPLLHGASLMECLSASNTITMHEIGEAFTGGGKFQYLLPFEAISVLLLACIIGGVTIARKE
ncbi:MAG: NADH-quinone oxidoreductase subunit J [Muribaculaceae bacterium]|nr:NADH-quinone oxidoreductase subunit J [Muribaculaceae bacterium]